MELIALSERVFSIPAFLSLQECEQLIALAERVGFEEAGVRTADGQVRMPSIRNNERAKCEASEWVSSLWSRLAVLALPRLSDQVATGLPKDVRFYKYKPGQRFKMHKDGPWHENGCTSKLTMLVYLNQNFEGGETDFRDFKVLPRCGDALLFIHDTWHEGVTVRSGVKYVLRSDVLYT
jgi:predicted 2-oxoglutarate/Fe(II)-dependent dioxygenase YbiX